MIGISAGDCVCDILAGKVKVEQVEKIFSPLDFDNEKEVKAFIAECQTSEWASNPKRGKTIFMNLYIEGKIERYHPRTKGYPAIEASGVWVDTEDKIRWRRFS